MSYWPGLIPTLPLRASPKSSLWQGLWLGPASMPATAPSLASSSAFDSAPGSAYSAGTEERAAPWQDSSSGASLLGPSKELTPGFWGWLPAGGGAVVLSCDAASGCGEAGAGVAAFRIQGAFGLCHGTLDSGLPAQALLVGLGAPGMKGCAAALSLLGRYPPGLLQGSGCTAEPRAARPLDALLSRAASEPAAPLLA